MLSMEQMVENINEYKNEFQDHVEDDRTPQDYLEEYSYIPDIYENLMKDLEFLRASAGRS